MKKFNINLNDLAFENISDWPKEVKLGAIVILMAVVVGLGYWVFVKSKFETYDSLQRQETDLKADFERKQHLASNLQAYRNQIEVMTELFGNMLKKLPTKDEMPGLLEDISRTGIASGLTFELFAPQKEIKHDFSIEIPIKIEVIGDYHQLAIFLSRVAEMGRIVTLHGFVIQPAGSDKQTANQEKLIMKLTAKIYRYRTQ